MRRSIFVIIFCVFALFIGLTLNFDKTDAQIKSAFEDRKFQTEAAPLVAPSPITLEDNPSCADLNGFTAAQYAHITTNYELKLDFEPPSGQSGPYPFTPDPTLPFDREYVGPQFPSENVRINRTGNTFNFTSTLGIAAVIVKSGGNQGSSNVYLYPQASFGDTNLSSPGARRAISHISFCYYIPARVTIIKSVENDNNNSSTQAFPFTATNFSPANFSLVDNNVTGPDRVRNLAVYSFGASNQITVTEGQVNGWSLSDITCDETEGGSGNGFPDLPQLDNSTVNLATRTANIIVEQGERITCTFKNVQVGPSAASAFISGRVLTQTGLPLRRAQVSVFNANTLETQTVYTNQLGYYRVDNLPVNDFYIVTVAHGKRAFSNNSQAFTLSDNLTDINFFVLY